MKSCSGIWRKGRQTTQHYALMSAVEEYQIVKFIVLTIQSTKAKNENGNLSCVKLEHPWNTFDLISPCQKHLWTRYKKWRPQKRNSNEHKFSLTDLASSKNPRKPRKSHKTERKVNVYDLEGLDGGHKPAWRCVKIAITFFSLFPPLNCSYFILLRKRQDTHFREVSRVRVELVPAHHDMHIEQKAHTRRRGKKIS